MNFMGKLLVIINLLFSLAVGFLILMVYIARTNWADGFEKMKNRYEVANARATVYEQQMLESQNRAGQEIKKLHASVAQLTQDADAARRATETAEAQLRAERDKANTGDKNVTVAQSALEQQKKEVANLTAALKEKDDYINNPKTGVLAKMDELRQRAVASEIERNSLQVIARQLEAKLQDMSKQLVKLQNGGTGSVAASGRPADNPPPENVEGLVSRTESGGLVKVTLGSDAGLAKGHTLKVYRIDPNPALSKFLGTIEIIEVNAHEAVGRPVQRMNGPIQVGDRVASKIL
jgi:hypothetical protein